MHPSAAARPGRTVLQDHSGLAHAVYCPQLLISGVTEVTPGTPWSRLIGLASSVTDTRRAAGAMGADHGRWHGVHRTDVQPHRTVPAEGVDHGEVGGGLLHHCYGWQQLGLVPRRNEQGHALHTAVVQGVQLPAERIWFDRAGALFRPPTGLAVYTHPQYLASSPFVATWPCRGLRSHQPSRCHRCKAPAERPVVQGLATRIDCEVDCADTGL